MSEFNRLERMAPRMPGHTCPEIDLAIGQISSVTRDAARAARHCEHDDTASALEDIERDLSRIELEPLRTANAQLRENAEWWRTQAEELCAQIERLESEAEPRS